jgi:hypothetical protein
MILKLLQEQLPILFGTASSARKWVLVFFPCLYSLHVWFFLITLDWTRPVLLILLLVVVRWELQHWREEEAYHVDAPIAVQDLLVLGTISAILVPMYLLYVNLVAKHVNKVFVLHFGAGAIVDRIYLIFFITTTKWDLYYHVDAPIEVQNLVVVRISAILVRPRTM